MRENEGFNFKNTKIINYNNNLNENKEKEVQNYSCKLFFYFIL